MKFFNKGNPICYEGTRKCITIMELFIGIRRNIKIKQNQVLRKSYKTMLLNIIYLLYSLIFSMTTLPLRYLLQYFHKLSYKVTPGQYITDIVSFTIVSWIIIQNTFLNANTMSKFVHQMNAIDRYLISSGKQHIYKEAQNRNSIILLAIMSFYFIETYFSSIIYPQSTILEKIVYRTVPLLCIIESVSFVTSLMDIIRRIQYGNATLCSRLNSYYQNSTIANVNDEILINNEDINTNIDKVINFYSKIVDACVLLNGVFYLPILFVFISNIGNIFSSFESVIFLAHSESEILIMELCLVMWGIHMLLCLVFVCFTCETLNQVLHEAQTFALKLVVYEKLPVNMQLRMQDLSHMLPMPGVGVFTVARLFTLNTSLLLRFLSFATTILIVLFQFYIMNKKE